MSEYPQVPQALWPPLGEASAPPPVSMQFASSARNTPLPWRNYYQNYTPFPIAVANNVGFVGGSQPHSFQQGNAYEVIDPPHCRGILSGMLKSVLSERMAHPESEVIAYHKESGDHGKMKITVTFETSGEM